MKHIMFDAETLATTTSDDFRVVGEYKGLVPATADDNRRNRRALVKALGKRQFKKLYRKAQA